MTQIRDPVCGLEFTLDEAEALGAERVERHGVTHWFCCPVCRAQWERKNPE